MFAWRYRFLNRLCVPALVVALLAAVSAAQAQVLVVGARSLDTLESAAAYALKMAGRENLAKQLEGLLAALTQGKGLKGIDKTLPLGVYVHLPATGQSQPQAVVFVPISDSKAVLELLEALNLSPRKDRDDWYTLTNDQGQSFYLRFHSRYALVSNSQPALEKPVAEAKLRALLPADALVAASLRIEEIPVALKQQFLEQVIKEAREREKEKRPGETQAQYELRMQTTEMAHRVLERVVHDTRALTVALSVDESQHQLALRALLEPQPNTPMALALQSLGTQPARFAALVRPEDHFGAVLHLPAPAPLRQVLVRAAREGFAQGLQQAKDDQDRLFRQHVFDAILAALDQPSWEGAIFLTAPGADGSRAAALLLQTGRGRQWQSIFEQFVAKLPEEMRRLIELNAAKVGNFTVHAIEVREGADDLRRIFGSPRIYLMVSDDTLGIGAGKDLMRTLEERSKKSKTAATREAAATALDLRLRMTALAELERPDKTKPAAKEIAREVFRGPYAGRDEVRLRLLVGEKVELRLDMDTPVLLFLFKSGRAGSAEAGL
ncbi:MAG: hypothetical protein C4297_04770 [Gemmataceae bacterium]